jgi:hypothetical protein
LLCFFVRCFLLLLQTCTGGVTAQNVVTFPAAGSGTPQPQPVNLVATQTGTLSVTCSFAVGGEGANVVTGPAPQSFTVTSTSLTPPGSSTGTDGGGGGGGGGGGASSSTAPEEVSGVMQLAPSAMLSVLLAAIVAWGNVRA